MSVVLGAEQAMDDIVQWSVGPIREGERRASAHSRRASYHSRRVVRSARLAGRDEGRYGRVVRGSSLVRTMSSLVRRDEVGTRSGRGRESSRDGRPWSGDSWRFVGNTDDIVRRWSGKVGNGRDCDV